MWKLGAIILLVGLAGAVADSSPKQRIGFSLHNQFRKEVNDGAGGVLGEYGMRTGDGCLRVTKFRATPTGGFKVISTHKEDCDPKRQLKAVERPKKPLRQKPAKVVEEPPNTVQETEFILPDEIPSPPSNPPPSPLPSLPADQPPSLLSSPPFSPPLSPLSSPPPSPSFNPPALDDAPAVEELPQTFQQAPQENIVPDPTPAPAAAGRRTTQATARPAPAPRPSSGPAKSLKPKSVQSPDRSDNLPKQLKKEFDYDSLSGDARARILDGEDDPVYAFGFTAPGHGHTQAGLPDGTKKGEYYFDSPDGWRRIVTYEANENGFFPKMRRIRIPGWTPPPPPPRRVKNRGPSRGDEESGGGEEGGGKGINGAGPDGRPDGGDAGESDGRPDDGQDSGPDGRPDGGRPDGRPEGELDGVHGGGPAGGDGGERGLGGGAEDAGKDGFTEGGDDREAGKQLLKELEQKAGVGSCPYYFFYSTKVNFHWERCLENGTKVGQYGKLHEDGYSYRTSYYADHTGYHPTTTKTFLSDRQRALVHDFVRGVFIVPQVDEERKRTEQRILKWLEENSDLLEDPLRELAAR